MAVEVIQDPTLNATDANGAADIDQCVTVIQKIDACFRRSGQNGEQVKKVRVHRSPFPREGAGLDGISGLDFKESTS